MKRKIYGLIAVVSVLALLLSGYTALAAQPYGPGDGNGDGRVTSADARFALRIAAGLHQANARERAACDVNYNGSVTSYDARMILCVAAHIYDLSYITPSTGDPSRSTVPSTEHGRGDSVPWDLILSQPTRPTEERTTLPPPTHPNNYYTKKTTVRQTETGAETTVPIPPEPATAPPEPGTVPAEPATVPFEPATGEPGLTQTVPIAPDTTQAPSVTVTPTVPAAERTRFSIRADRPGDGTIVFTVAVRNAQGLKSGMLNIEYDPGALEFVSAVGTEEVGVSVNIRHAPAPEIVGCEFSFNEPLLADSFDFGTVTFRPTDPSAEGTTVGVRVQEPAAYHWKSDGDRVSAPDLCRYYVNIAGSAPETTQMPAIETQTPTAPAETQAPTAPTRIAGDTETATLSIRLDRTDAGELVFTLMVEDAQALKSGMLNFNFDPGVLEFVSCEGVKDENASVDLRPTPAPGMLGCEFSFREPLCAETFVLGTVTFRPTGSEAKSTSVVLSVQAPNSYNWRTDADWVISPENCSYYVILSE